LSTVGVCNPKFGVQGSENLELQTSDPYPSRAAILPECFLLCYTYGPSKSWYAKKFSRAC